jgi:hypothetical protein
MGIWKIQVEITLLGTGSLRITVLNDKKAAPPAGE